MASTESADRLLLLWPREEDRPRAVSPSFSQREVSIDGLACEPFQLPAVNQRQLLSRYPAPL